MAEGAAKSPRKEAIRLSKLLELSLGSDRFPVDVAALAKEVSRNRRVPEWISRAFECLRRNMITY